MPTYSDLKQLQSLPLEAKILKTTKRITEWYNHWNGDVYVSFSGGKDSTVLLDIVRSIYPEVEAVFINTGLEFPEIQRFIRSFDNVIILRPKMSFKDVISKYGYPMISKEVSRCVYEGRKALQRNDGTHQYQLDKLNGVMKDKNGNPSRFNTSKYKPLLYTDFIINSACCDIMKKKPVHQFAKETGKKPMTGQMADEGRLRTQQWLLNGCNGFEMKSPISNPLSFWTEQDILEYIYTRKLPIAEVYGEVVADDEQMSFFNERPHYHTTGADRTGCIYCGYGAHLEKESRFERLKQTHPKQYNYVMNGGEFVNGIWKPNKEGLGLGYVIDRLNEIYGQDFIRR